MTYQVLSRKYRPQRFEELVGQDHVGRILRNAIAGDRVGHAYLFVGPRGVGKTTMARIFAKALNCARRADGGPPDPCGACPSCHDIAAGVDLDVVEMDAASNNHVEDVRRLREQVGYATVRSPHRIWIVDEVHMLSVPAFNAFLKTLEEPPDRVKFLFCTTEEHKLPDTFRSRCQRIEFRPIDADAMSARLARLAAAEGIEVEPGLCDEIAAGALGGLRDAESLLEQLIAACPDGTVRVQDLDALAGRTPRALLGRLLDAVRAGDAAASLEAVDACLASGAKPGVLLEQWLEALRQDLVRAARGETGDDRPTGLARVARSIDVLLAKRAHLRAGADGFLVLQVAAVEVARLPDARDLDALLARLDAEGPREPVPRAAAAARAPEAQPTPRADPGRPPARPPARETPSAPPPPPPSVGQDATGGPPSRGDVEASWPDLLRAADAVDARLAEALRRTRVVDLVEGRLGLGVAEDDLLARTTLERRESVLTFRRLTTARFGVPLAPRIVLEAPARAAEEVRAADPQEHPDIRLVREATGGRLLDVERAGERRAGGSGADGGA